LAHGLTSIERMKNQRKAIWEKMFKRLAAFRRKHGHCRVPVRYGPDRRFGNWVSLQRQWALRGKLTPSRRRRLLALGVVLVPLAAHWDKMAAGLAAFKRRHGHTLVPRQWNEPRGLGGWVARQRHLHYCGRLPAARVRRLEQMGFDFAPEDPRWNAQYARLVAFQKEHGHCNVRSGDAFGQWVYKQRKFRRQGRLDGGKIRRLDAIGFEWVKPGRVAEFNAARWQRNVRALMAFKEQHGHTRVPGTQNGRRGLGVWVANLRQEYRAGRLIPERLASLKNLGFVWDCDEDHWRERLNQLLEFKKEFGHPNVPSSYRDRRLANFIGNLRKSYRRGTLDPERLRVLSEMGMTWNFRK
jgi:hypothetical protein